MAGEESADAGKARLAGPLANAAALGIGVVEETAELVTRRAAVTELGAQVRALVEAVATTEAPTDELLQLAGEISELVSPLAAARRTREQAPGVDDLMRAVRMYNPVIGAGNPIAPPLRVESADGRATATCTLGLVYEGPPMYVHGGISAMLLDQVLGHAAMSAGRPGVTAELTVRFRRPVPLQTPLRVWAEIAEEDGDSRTIVRGGITTVDAPGVDLVRAQARFVSLRLDQAKGVFWPGGIGPNDPAAAHD